MRKGGEHVNPTPEIEVIAREQRFDMLDSIQSPLVPDFVRSRVQPVLAGAHLLTQDQIDTLVATDLESIHWRISPLQIHEETRATQAYYIPPNSRYGEAIVLNQSWLEMHDDTPFHLKSALAHEAGHALSEGKERPLKQIEDGATALLGFGTKDDLVSAVNSFREERGLDPDCTDNTITAETRGFRTRFVDHSGLAFPIEPAQVAFEEARGVILGFVFEAISYGRGVPNMRTPEQQFRSGRKILFAYTEARRTVDAYIAKFGGIQKGLHALFADLYFMDADTFFATREASLTQPFLHVAMEELQGIKLKH